MPTATAKQSQQPRRLKALRIDEISLCRSPANQFAVALLRKSAGTTSTLEQRMDALERRSLLKTAPDRLLKAVAQRGEELRAAAEGRAHLPPLPVTIVAKDAGGGARLVARCTELRKSMIAAAAPVPAQSPPVTKAAASPAQGLIAAAHRRAVQMRST